MTSARRAPQRQTQEGFTLIEILVVIVIIGVLATMGVSKYTEFTTTSRVKTCTSNQTSIDKSVGVWESQKCAITKKSQTTITFDGGGDIVGTSGTIPTGLDTSSNKRAIADYVRDDNVFMCPEYANQNGGYGNTALRSSSTYLWISDTTSESCLNNNRRGVACWNYGAQSAGGTLMNGPDGTQNTSHR